MPEHCALCHQREELQDSHLIAKGFYKIVTEAGEPIAITPEKVRHTSKQISRPLLCTECEQRFSDEGEQYTIENCSRGSGNFPIHDLLQDIAPEQQNDKIAMYDAKAIRGVDVRQLTYFAASVFWRASVVEWKTGYRNLVASSLGERYTEEFRRFLLDEVSFPSNASLFLFVGCTADSPVIVAPYKERDAGHYRHEFAVPGLLFMLFVGQQVPDRLKWPALSHSGKLFVVDFSESGLQKKLDQVLHDAPKSGRLRKSLDEDDMRSN